MMAPNITNPMMNPTPDAELKVRLRNRSSGMIGSATLVSTMQKREEQDRTEEGETDDGGRTPPVLGSSPRGHEDDDGDPGREERRTGPVDLVRHPHGGQVQHGGDGEQSQIADGHVDVEDPAPRQVLGEQATGQRPATLVSPKTTPKYPMYFPRCRAGTTSPMMACAPTSRPPAPIPWTARNAMSSIMFCDRPESMDPIRKITIDNWKRFFRP